MRKNTIYSILLAGVAIFTTVSCSEDDLSSDSVITTDKQDKTPFDYWLMFSLSI